MVTTTCPGSCSPAAAEAESVYEAPSRKSSSPRNSPRSCGPCPASTNFSPTPAPSEPGTPATGYGVRATHYQILGEALLAALAAILGDTFDAPTRQAWTLAYNLVAETMLEGAAAARPIGS